MWPFNTGKRVAEEEKLVSANLGVVVDLLLSVCSDSSSSDLKLKNHIQDFVFGIPAVSPAERDVPKVLIRGFLVPGGRNSYLPRKGLVPQ